MGSIDIKSDQKVSEPELELANNGTESMVDSSTSSDESDLLELISEHTSATDIDANESKPHSPPNEEKASCSSSTSSSDFELEDPFQDIYYSYSEKTNNGNDYTTKSPSIQTMDRLSPTAEKYRIPSSVFARKESHNNGWGMPSNESLFSIQMGGMSFRNQDSLIRRSDDLDPMAVGMIPEMDETCESDGDDDKDHESVEEGRSHKLGEGDKIQSLSEIGNSFGSRVADEPNVNSQSDQEDQGSKSVVEELNSHFSKENVGSRSSFAFPILTADADKGPLASSVAEKSEPQTQAEPQAEPDKQTEPSEVKANPPASTWTNCFGCCTFCS